MPSYTRAGFRGVYPMVYALFDAEGHLSRSAMKRQLEFIAASGAHGVAALGLASEVNKLSLDERLTLLAWVAENKPKNLPLAVTVAELSVDARIDFLRRASEMGANWAILQPPQVKGVPEDELIRFFGAIADKSPIPVGIQNAPQYLGVGLSPRGLGELARRHPNVSVAKLEATALSVKQVIEESEGALDVFNGRGGVEMIDSLKAGAVGIIPGAETVDILVKIYDAYTAGTYDVAETAYSNVLPVLTFLMDSMDTFLVYGKQLIGLRISLSETDVRSPHTPKTKFGVDLIAHYASQLHRLKQGQF